MGHTHRGEATIKPAIIIFLLTLLNLRDHD